VFLNKGHSVASVMSKQSAVFLRWSDKNDAAMWFVRQEDFSVLRNFLSSRYTQNGQTFPLLTVLNTKFTESKLSDLDDVSVMSLLVAGNETAEVRSVATYVVRMVGMHCIKHSSPEIVE